MDKPARKAQKKEKASKDASSQPQGPEVSRPGTGGSAWKPSARWEHILGRQ